jgi:hypothetical protein
MSVRAPGSLLAVIASILKEGALAREALMINLIWLRDAVDVKRHCE